MKKIIFLLVLLSHVALSADEILLFDNSIRKATIKSVTGDSIEYYTSDNVTEKVLRKLVEKIIYTEGKEIEFYDKIYLNDNSFLKGRVIKKSDGYIEFNPAGAIPFDKIEISSIAKIIYEDGNVENFKTAPDSDLIYFKDGTVLKAGSIIINQKNVEFLDENGFRQYYGRDMIEKIVYKNGQTEYLNDSAKEGNNKLPSKPEKPVNSFIEIEWGWNGYAGAGLRFDYLLIGNFTINGAAGLGLWGYRASGAFRYYTEYPYGLALSLGASINTGQQLKMEMETTDSYGDNYTETVTFDCKPVACINGSVLYSFRVNGDDKLYIETGYSYALQDKKYTYKTESGRVLSKESEDFMDVIAPGGFMISIGYAVML